MRNPISPYNETTSKQDLVLEVLRIDLFDEIEDDNYLPEGRSAYNWITLETSINLIGHQLTLHLQ